MRLLFFVTLLLVHGNMEEHRQYNSYFNFVLNGLLGYVPKNIEGEFCTALCNLVVSCRRVLDHFIK